MAQLRSVTYSALSLCRAQQTCGTTELGHSAYHSSTARCPNERALGLRVWEGWSPLRPNPCQEIVAIWSFRLWPWALHCSIRAARRDQSGNRAPGLGQCHGRGVAVRHGSLFVHDRLHEPRQRTLESSVARPRLHAMCMLSAGSSAASADALQRCAMVVGSFFSGCGSEF